MMDAYQTSSGIGFLYSGPGFDNGSGAGDGCAYWLLALLLMGALLLSRERNSKRTRRRT